MRRTSATGMLLPAVFGLGGCAASEARGLRWPVCDVDIYDKYDVKAVDVRTGEAKWQHALGTAVSTPSLVSGSGALHVHDRGGRGAWCFELPSGESITLDRCRVIASSFGKPQAENELPDWYYLGIPRPPGSFEVRLSSQRSVQLQAVPTGMWFLRGGVIASVGDGFTDSLGELVAFDPSTGEKLWSRLSTEPGRVAVSRLHGGLVALLPGGRILFIDSSGHVAREVLRRIVQPHPSLWKGSRFIDMGDVTILALYEELIALDATTFAFLWSAPRNTDQVRPIRWNDLVIYGVPQKVHFPFICDPAPPEPEGRGPG